MVLKWLKVITASPKGTGTVIYKEQQNIRSKTSFQPTVLAIYRQTNGEKIKVGKEMLALSWKLYISEGGSAGSAALYSQCGWKCVFVHVGSWNTFRKLTSPVVWHAKLNFTIIIMHA